MATKRADEEAEIVEVIPFETRAIEFRELVMFTQGPGSVRLFTQSC